jgi:hypothetical protein
MLLVAVPQEPGQAAVAHRRAPAPTLLARSLVAAAVAWPGPRSAPRGGPWLRAADSKIGAAGGFKFPISPQRPGLKFGIRPGWVGGPSHWGIPRIQL